MFCLKLYEVGEKDLACLIIKARGNFLIVARLDFMGHNSVSNNSKSGTVPI